MAAHLSAQDIYDKEFSVNARGYSADEVDSFLDDVIEDYQNYEEQVQVLKSALETCDQKIKELTAQNESLESEKKQLSEKLDTTESSLKEAQDQIQQAANEKAALAAAGESQKELTLEERVARLEKAVFSASTAEK